MRQNTLKWGGLVVFVCPIIKEEHEGAIIMQSNCILLMLITSKYPVNIFLKPFMSSNALTAPHLKDWLLNCDNFHTQHPSDVLKENVQVAKKGNNQLEAAKSHVSGKTLVVNPETASSSSQKKQRNKADRSAGIKEATNETAGCRLPQYSINISANITSTHKIICSNGSENRKCTFSDILKKKKKRGGGNMNLMAQLSYSF